MYHILVVEDDQDINRLLCRILTDGGYDVRPAFSGSEAVLWAEQYDYDLVLLDLMLPGLTGEEFIAQMRKKKTTMTWKKISTNNRKNPAPKMSIRSANFSPISVPNARLR